MKKTIIIAAAIIASIATAASFAIPNIVAKSHAPMHHKLQADKLNLNKDQKAKMKQIVIAARPGLQNEMLQLRSNHHKLNQLILKDKLDQQAIGSLADQQGKIVANIIKLRAQMRHKIFLILTKDQQQKARELASKPHPAA